MLRELLRYRYTDKFFTLFPALERLLPKVTKRQKLIDLACGTGDLYDFLVAKGYDYTGLDISEDMLSQAKKKHSQATFLKGDATQFFDEKQKFEESDFIFNYYQDLIHRFLF